VGGRTTSRYRPRRCRASRTAKSYIALRGAVGFAADVPRPPRWSRLRGILLCQARGRGDVPRTVRWEAVANGRPAVTSKTSGAAPSELFRTKRQAVRRWPNRLISRDKFRPAFRQSYWRFVMKLMRAGSPFLATTPRLLCKPPRGPSGRWARQSRLGTEGPPWVR
jgi:hypothetical protein